MTEFRALRLGDRLVTGAVSSAFEVIAITSASLFPILS